jgi:hypothetical protein
MHGVADAARKKHHRTSSRSRISVARSARRSPAKRNRIDLRSRSARRKSLARLFRLRAGSIPVGVIVETGTAWGRAGCWGPAVLFLEAQYRSLSCWYFCWYRQLSTMKTTSNSNCYGIRRLSARGTNLRGFAAGAGHAGAFARTIRNVYSDRVTGLETKCLGHQGSGTPKGFV